MSKLSHLTLREYIQACKKTTPLYYPLENDQESALIKLQSRWQLLINPKMFCHEFSWRSRVDGSCQIITPAQAELMGMTQADATNFGWLNAIHPDDIEPSGLHYARACAEKQIYQRYYRFVRPDKSVKYVFGFAFPVYDQPDGKVIEYWGRLVNMQRADWEAARLIKLE